MLPDSVRTPADVTEFATWLFGRPFEPRRGLVHVVSVVPHADDLMVMRIRSDTPRSRYDAFVLSLGRARADAIVTTGRILREEPALRHDLSWTPKSLAAFQDWGREVRGQDARRLSIVLTGGEAFPADHPLLDGVTRVVVLCPASHADLLRERFAHRSVDVIGSEHPDLAVAVETARAVAGARTVLLEAGPTTVTGLYASGPGPDELMLSEYLGVVPSGVPGGRLVSRDRLAECYGPIRYGPTTRGDDGKPWRFAWVVREQPA